MIIGYILHTVWITNNLLIASSALMLRNDHLTEQAVRFFSIIRDDFLIYGITQDCQLYFVEQTNYILIRSLKVDRSNTYCYPNLVKVHLRQGNKQISLMLVVKQVGNRICTLPIEMPALQTINNGQIFSYSVFTSLPYTACSHLIDGNFILEPDLSFMDTTFSDIIYFINAKSAGSQWDVRQFWINEHGNLVAIKKFAVQHQQKGGYFSSELASQFIVELDLKRSLLYTIHRLRKNLVSECSFDLLFRPTHLITKWIEFDKTRSDQEWLESFALDGHLMLYVKSVRRRMGTTFELYGANLRNRDSKLRLLHLDFVTDIGVIRKQTYAELSERNVPAFADLRQTTAQTAYGVQRLTTPYSPKIHAVVNVSSPKTVPKLISKSEETTTINGIDQFYSEIENVIVSSAKDRKSWSQKVEVLITSTTSLPQTITTQQRYIDDSVEEIDIRESDEKLVGNMEEARDNTSPSNIDEFLWEGDTQEKDEDKKTEILSVNTYNSKGNEKGSEVLKDIFKLPQQIYPEKDEAINTTVRELDLETGYNEMTASFNKTYKLNCALMMQPVVLKYIFIYFFYSYYFE